MNKELNLYDLNKNILVNFPALEEADILKPLKDFDFTGEYYLLYGKEIGYFTLFKRESTATESFHKIFIECLENIGEVVACDITEDETALEIWVKLPEESVTILYLFNYDAGVEKFYG